MARRHRHCVGAIHRLWKVLCLVWMWFAGIRFNKNVDAFLIKLIERVKTLPSGECNLVFHQRVRRNYYFFMLLRDPF